MSSLGWKLQRLRMLIAEGRYRDLFVSLKANMPFFLNRGKMRDTAIYLSLRRKYHKFLDVPRSPQKQLTGGGHKNIIWWLWLQGVDKAPDICKACLASLRRWHPDKEIITVDSDSLAEYITFPAHIEDKYRRGIITRAHYSDLVRLELLAQHGGTWIDSTVLCTGRKTEYVMHLPLFAFKWTGEIAYAASSWFMVSDPHDPIIELTRNMMYQYWQDYDCLKHYFLVHMFFTMAAKAFREEWDKVPFLSNQPPFHMGDARFDDYTEEKMKYFEGISDFHKLTYKPKDGVMPSKSSIFQHVIDQYKIPQP